MLLNFLGFIFCFAESFTLWSSFFCFAAIDIVDEADGDNFEINQA
jgi:hypothetical protein